MLLLLEFSSKGNGWVGRQLSNPVSHITWLPFQDTQFIYLSVFREVLKSLKTLSARERVCAVPAGKCFKNQVSERVRALKMHISAEPRETGPNSLAFWAIAIQGMLMIVHPENDLIVNPIPKFIFPLCLVALAFR